MSAAKRKESPSVPVDMLVMATLQERENVPNTRSAGPRPIDVCSRMDGQGKKNRFTCAQSSTSFPDIEKNYE